MRYFIDDRPVDYEEFDRFCGLCFMLHGSSWEQHSTDGDGIEVRRAISPSRVVVHQRPANAEGARDERREFMLREVGRNAEDVSRRLSELLPEGTRMSFDLSPLQDRSSSGE